MTNQTKQDRQNQGQSRQNQAQNSQNRQDTNMQDRSQQRCSASGGPSGNSDSGRKSHSDAGSRH